MTYYVYILRTDKDTLYVGQTNNLKKRLGEHKRGAKKAKYLRMFKGFTLVYQEEFKSRSEAMIREYELKRFSKDKKENLIKIPIV